MKCRRAKTLIYDFIDGMLGDSDRAMLEQHLGDCRHCEKMASGLTKSLELLRRAPKIRPDENFNWKVRLAIQKERDAATRRATGPATWVRAWNTRFAMGAVAAFAVVVTVGFYAVSSFDSPAGLSKSPAFTSNSPVEQGPVPVASNTPGTRGKVLVNPGAVQPRQVSNGLGAATTASNGLIQEGPAPLLDTDALRSQFDKTRRMRSLEDQINALQTELRSCELKDCDE